MGRIGHSFLKYLPYWLIATEAHGRIKSLMNYFCVIPWQRYPVQAVPLLGYCSTIESFLTGESVSRLAPFRVA